VEEPATQEEAQGWPWGRMGIGLAVLALVAVLGGYGLALRARPEALRIDLSSPAPEGAVGGRIFVHVAGAVQAPGLYRLSEGSRVAEAIEAAGGPTAEADLDALNLASVLQDADKVLVPERGQASAPGGGPAPGGGSTLVNLNTATQSDLETLPGIGPALAQRILAYRSEHGTFRAVEDLINVSGIGPKTLENLRDLVTV
jgi:competence protein ComEA